jgi:nucleoside diphosphate kinase
MAAENIERSLVLIKPDALKNSLTGYIPVSYTHLTLPTN